MKEEENAREGKGGSLIIADIDDNRGGSSDREGSVILLVPPLQTQEQAHAGKRRR